MATYLDNLKTQRDNLASQLASMLASPKPTYSVDGQSVNWADHYKTLSELYEKVTKQIMAAEPFWLTSQMM